MIAGAYPAIAVSTVPVPCDGCTVCCHDELIILHPEDGDEPGLYLTQAVRHPLTGRPAIALRQRPDGRCIYLEEGGCSIHGRAPIICRKFDCRRMAAKMRELLGRADYRRASRENPVIREGHARKARP